MTDTFFKPSHVIYENIQCGCFIFSPHFKLTVLVFVKHGLKERCILTGEVALTSWNGNVNLSLLNSTLTIINTTIITK